MPQQHVVKAVLGGALLALCCLTAPLIGQAQSHSAPEVAITVVPRAGEGPIDTDTIAGEVRSEEVTRYKIVLFARTNQWYIQPYTAAPYTAISHDGTWKSTIHLGYEYAALLVEPAFYRPPATLTTLPNLGGGVLAIARVPAKR